MVLDVSVHQNANIFGGALEGADNLPTLRASKDMGECCHYPREGKTLQSGREPNLNKHNEVKTVKQASFARLSEPVVRLL